MKTGQTNIDQKLLVLYLLDEISQPGRARVEAWLSASEENRSEYESLRKTWEETGKIEPASVKFDTGRAWDRMSRRIVTDIKAYGRSGTVGATRGRPGQHAMRLRSKRSMMRFIPAAAAVVMLMAVSAVFIRFLQNRQEAGLMTLTSYSVPVQDTLTDGSTVVLNADTRLIVPKKFAKTSRAVKLRGEAFFQVEHDASRPFIIDAGIGQAKVLGTSFHVKAYPESDLEVYVESGMVELSAVDSVSRDTSKIVLKAGERGMIRIGSNSISKPNVIGPDELFWANKKLIFQETRLSLVFELLKKHYDADIDVKDPAILNCLLSATFTDEPIGQILEVVTASFDLKISRDRQKFIINGKGCGNEE